MDETFIVRLPDSQTVLGDDQVRSRGFFILESIWKPDFVNLVIIKGTEQFSGIIRYELFKQISSSLEIDYKSFFTETKKAITTNSGITEFSYLVNDEFVWKKRKEKKVEIIYGKANLEKKSNLHLEMLFNSVEMISNLKKNLDEKCKEQEAAMQKQTKLKQLLKTVTETKEKNENEVYTKFICLLNAKKAKIEDFKSSAAGIEDEAEEVETSANYQNSSSIIPIKNVPKRRKFEPVKAVKTTEKKTQIIPKAQQPESTDDLLDEM